jgi:pimeloyl-ACP methyl ester carboxylesterase
MRSRRRRIVTILLVLLGAYALLIAVLTVTQDMIVFPGAGRGDRGLPSLPGLTAGTLQRQDGESFRIVTVERGPARAVALYFVGNGEDLYRAASTGYLLAGYGLEVIGVEYPGYGASPGRPSVATVLGNADAAAARARARARELDVPLVVIGSSLGSCSAVHVAAQGGVDRLVLRAPLTSLVATAQRRFPWLPVAWFLRHRFDNLARAPEVRCPVLVVHGDRDRIVPLESGRELAAAIGDHAELIVAAGYGHNDLSIVPDGPFGSRVAAFLADSTTREHR